MTTARPFNRPFARLAVRVDAFRAGRILATAHPATIPPEVAARREAYFATIAPAARKAVRA